MSELLKARFDVTTVGLDDLVYGFGMVTHVEGQPYVDTDNQSGYDELCVKAATDFMVNSRQTNDEHDLGERQGVNGEVIHSLPAMPELMKSLGYDGPVHGWIVGVKFDEQTTEMYRTGERTGFSIEGTGTLEDLT